MIIGLTGVARSGKDTVGQILVEHHNFERRAFADKLRAVALGADPYVRLQHSDSNGFLFGERFLRLSTVVETYGWEKAKEQTDVRRFLQRLGTEGVRENLGFDVWVEAAMWDLLSGQDYAFTDVRYDNEAEAITGCGGVVWKITRPGYAPVNAHASDAGLDERFLDRIIHNDGSFDDLRRRVDSCIRHELEYGDV